MSSERVGLGYFVTTPVPRPPYAAADLLPAEVVSLSPCLATFLPDAWAFAWASGGDDERLARAAHFGLDRGALAGLEALAERALAGGDLGFPNVCLSLEAARSFAALPRPPGRETWVIGASVAAGHRDALLDVLRPAAGQGPPGVYLAAERAEPPAPGGRELGYELIAFEGGISCSWLCSGLERAARERLGAPVNAFGLLADEAHARALAGLVDRGDVAAEPCLYLPVRVMRY